MNSAPSKAAFEQRFNVNIDLAVEAHERLRGEAGCEIPGVAVSKRQHDLADITLVEILDQQGAQLMQKAPGKYLTLTAPQINSNNQSAHRRISEILAEQIAFICQLTPQSKVLLAGLGNWQATPDALGPRVINKVLVTRHLQQFAPADLPQDLREISAVAPGVLGITGIETAEILSGIVANVKPDLVIAIDALAAGSPERIGTTVQIADSGINPGSGLGNKRQAISLETLGVPVIAIGIPTVVNAALIARSSIQSLLSEIQEEPALHSWQQQLNPLIMEQIIERVLQPFSNSLLVTPKEIDQLIDSAAKIISAALNLALQPQISSKTPAYYQS